MKHDTIKNDFFAGTTNGPSKEINLRTAVEMAIGYSLFMSKRLSPPSCICNARIYTAEGDFVFKSDIEVFKEAAALRNISEVFGTELFIFGESGQEYYWRSSQPTMWQGGHEVDGKWVTETPISFTHIRPYFVKKHKQSVRQWSIDHGLLRRSPKEWLKSATYRWKNALTEIAYYRRQKDINLKTKVYYVFRWLFCI